MALVPSMEASSNELQVFASSVGLGDCVDALEKKLRNASHVMYDAREIEIKNEALVESLPELQHLMHDAEEVLDEIDYFRMRAELDGADEEMLDVIHKCPQDSEIDGGSDDTTTNN